MNVFYLAAAFFLGILVSTQPPINAQAAMILGSPLLAAIGSIMVSLILIVVAKFALDATPISAGRIASLPWWTLVGGVAGALFVIGALLVAPRIGVAGFFVFVVLGQLSGAALIDHLGAFGAPVSPIAWPRAVGILLVFVGAALTQLRA